jgi:hypothetical protein
MKKTLLALAITALSANAFALNLDTPATPGTQVFASEITVAATGTDIGAAAVVATVKAGFALPTGSYVRFDLTNGAKFKTVPVLTGVTSTVASGGTGQTFVIYTTTAILASADVLTLTSADGITVVNQSAVSISYGLFETAGGATTQTGNLNAKSGTLLSFAPALNITATASTALKIDAISNGSKKFATGVLTTPVTTLAADFVAGRLLATGVAVSAATDIAPTAAWTVNGNFSAVNTLTAAAGGAPTIATDKQSVTFAANAVAPALVTYVVTGLTDIAETTLSAVYTPTVTAGYTVAAKTLTPAGSLVKNGTTKTVNLALKPGGVYSNFVRISNTDTITGAFFIKVINDAGASANFALSSVAGQSATLAAGASTTQMTIQSIFDAAVAQGLALSGEGKLRLEVTGQTNGLDVQTYTVSKDGNSFATF